jgi:hypothetical protein
MFSERKGSQVPTSVNLHPPFASLSFALPYPSKVSFQRSSLPFASLGATAGFGHAQTEPATGVSYPPEFCILTKKHCPQLAGAG